MRLRPLLGILLLAAAASGPLWGAASAPAEPPRPGASSTRPQDSVWLISTRHLGCSHGGDPQNPDFQVIRYDRDQGWEESDFDAFLQTGTPDGITAVFVHGNRVGWSTAFDRGLLAYRALIEGVDDPRPVRFVIWSWPSAQIRGPLRDVRSKAARADHESHYLAWFLARVDPNARVGLFGFSYGGRIISGALHLAGGGTLCGRPLAIAGTPRQCKPRAVLMAAAMHNYWLLPDCRHGRCPSEADRLLIQYNPCDHVLHMYHLVERCSRPRALGYTGLPCLEDLGKDAARIEQQDVHCEIGNHHNVRLYFDSPRVMDKVREYVLWENSTNSGS